MKKYNEGEEVKWNRGQGQASGEVHESYTEKVTKQIKGNDISEMHRRIIRLI